MVPRYSIKEVENLVSEENKFKRWAQAELAIVKCLYKHKVITQNEYLEINKHFIWDIKTVNKYEEKTKHDVYSFICCLNELINSSAKKWIHFGVTSTDIVDTANGLLYVDLNKLIEKDLSKLLSSIKRLAKKHINTLQLARTHGQNAEPTTFGIKILNWYDQLSRGKKCWEKTKNFVETGKISGAVGTYAHFEKGPKFQDDVCKILKLNSATTSTQVLARDRHAQYFNSLIILITSIASFANEIRLLTLDGINEVSEATASYQVGSSAMPQKRNPIGCENICGLARVIQGYATVVYQNMILWNERDISHSSTERILNQDFISLVLYILRRFNDIINNLIVHKDKMMKNLLKSAPQIYSQTVMLYLIKEHKIQRLDAYNIAKEFIKKNMTLIEIVKVLNEKLSIKINLKKLEMYLNPKYHIRHNQKILIRILKDNI